MITITILATACTATATAVLVILLRLGIGREESDSSLHGEPATRAAALTRRIVGWHGPIPQHLADADHQNHQAKAHYA
jgi:hypothetical protein